MRTQMAITLAMALALGSSAQAATVFNFDSESNYTDNFRETADGAALSWDSNGYVTKSGGEVYSTAVYDTTPSDNTEINEVELGAVQMDFQLIGAGQVGIYVDVGAPDEGYLALIRDDQFHIYDMSDPRGADWREQTGRRRMKEYPTLNNDGTWYTAVVERTLDAGQFTLDVAVYDQGDTGGTPIHQMAFTTSDPVTTDPGQIGFLARSTASIDNFTIVPEPATVGLLGIGGLVLLRRRNR